MTAWLTTRSADIPHLKEFLERKQAYCSHDICNELLTLMSTNLLRQLLAIVRRSPFFSVIVDETTDCATKEQVSICIRYLNDQLEPTESFIGLYEVTSTTGDNIARVLLDTLTRCNLPLAFLRGQCYDGASNMSGIINGVQNRIKQQQPLALFVHCSAHALNLVLQEAAREVPLIRDSMDYLHRAAILLGRSAKRKAILDDLSANIRPMCPTRWAVRAKAIVTGIENYEKLIQALDMVAQEQSHTDARGEARGLSEQFGHSKMYWSLLVAKSVFTHADRLAEILQAEKMTVNDSLKAVRLTKTKLLALRCDAVFDQVMQETKEAR
jgi:hypothetical protein